MRKHVKTIVIGFVNSHCLTHLQKSKLTQTMRPIKINHQDSKNLNTSYPGGRPHKKSSHADAVRLFLRRVAVEHAFPLELKVPNAETRAAMLESRAMIAIRKTQAV